MADGPGVRIARSSAMALLLVGGLAHAAEPPAPAAVTGDVAHGLALFTGATPLQAGGAPCGACHAIGAGGGLLAASFGPELSKSFDGMPPEAVDGLLQDLPFPSMAPIYAGRALTAQERADLASFLVAATGRPPPAGQPVAGIATALGALLLVVMATRARRRKPPTRGTLVARPPAPPRRPLVARAADAETTRARSAQGGHR